MSLLRAVEANDLQTVKKLIDSGVDVNETEVSDVYFHSQRFWRNNEISSLR